MKQRNELQQSFEKQSALLNKLNGELTQAKEIFEQCKKQADETEYQWHSTQAAQLAKTLELGAACPVCGSEEHPAPARFSGNEVTKEHVEQAREVQVKAQADFDHVSGRVQKGQMVVAKTEQNLLSVDEQIKSQPQLESDIERLEVQHQSLSNEIQGLERIDINTMTTQLVGLETQLKQVESELVIMRDAVTQNQVAKSKWQTELDAQNEAIPNEYQQLEKVVAAMRDVEQRTTSITANEQATQQAAEKAAVTWAEAKASVEALTNQVRECELELEKSESEWLQTVTASVFDNEQDYMLAKRTSEQIVELEKAISTFESKTEQLKGAIASLEQSLEGQSELPDMNVLEVEMSSAQDKQKEALALYTEYKSKLDQVEQVTKKIQLLYAENEKLDKEYQVIGTLSDIANGKTGSKVSLHRFVLGVLLDDVLIQASMRLRTMSKGRYELKRKEERAKGNVGSGLDLMVEDGYTGKWRDVATLSGGESFMRRWH